MLDLYAREPNFKLQQRQYLCFQELLPFFVGLILCTETEGPHLRLGGPEDKAMFPQGAGHVFNLVTMEMCHPYC